MKIFTKILIALLALTTLIPFMVASMCLFNQTKALEFFDAEMLSADLEKVLFVLGGFILATAILPILAIVWLIKRKTDGYVLAYVAGFIALGRGLLTLFYFNTHGIDNTKLTMTPIVIGVILLLFSYLAAKQEHRIVRLP